MKKRLLRISFAFLMAAFVLSCIFIEKSHAISFGDIIKAPFRAVSGIFKPKADPQTQSMSLYEPQITKYYMDENDEPVISKPDPIIFNFNSSAANIKFLDSEITNISMTPSAEGTWKWENEYSLVFTPKNDWPAGEEYKIKLPKEIFKEKFALSQYLYTIQIPAFNASLEDFKIYQDPKNHRIHQLQAVFSFTHPVDTKIFESNLSLKIDTEIFPVTFTYDRLKRNAYVVSEPIKILNKDQTAAIELATAKAATGGKALRYKVTKMIDIPSQDKFFRIANVSAVFIKNQQEDPEQFIELSFTDGVNTKEIANKVELYLLPLTNPKESSNRQEYVYDDDYENGYYDDYGNYIEPVRYKRPYSYNWRFSEVTPELLESSKKLNIELIEDISDVKNVFMFRYNAPDMAKRYLYVNVKEGIKSQIDFVIKKSYRSVIQSKSFPKEVSLLQNGAILPLEGSKRLTFKTRGVNGVKVDISRVMPDQLNHLISQTNGTFAKPYFNNSYNFNESNISQSFSKIIPLEVAVSKANYSSIDMSEYLKSQYSSGLFFVKVQGYNTKEQSYDGPADNRFILATDLGILAKRDSSNKYHVFVMSIQSGLPVSGVKIDILGKNGIPVLTQYTDDNGCAVFNKIQGFNNEKQPVAYVATKGNDISFMPFARYDRSLNFSRFDIDGERSSSRDKGLKAFIFSDRGIYRPGDDINFGAIVKNEKWDDVSGIPVKFVLRDPYSKVVFEKTVTLNNTGFLTFDEIKTYNISPTGTYLASLYIVKGQNNESFIGSESIRIEEFRTDTIKVNAKITGGSGTGWIIPQNLKALTTVNNFFGTPAQGRVVKAEYSVTPRQFSFSKYADFSFPDPYKLNERNAIQSVTENFDDVRTTESGEAEFAFDLSKYSGGTYNLVFSAEAFEGDSGKSVFAYDSVRISPYKYLVGYKTASKLSYLNKGSAATLDLIALDNNLNSIELKNLKLKVYQRQYLSSLVKQNNGVYKYQSTTKDTLLNDNSFSISLNGGKVTLDTKNHGNFFIEIENENGLKILNLPYFIAGSSNQSLTIEKDASLMINLRNDSVEPGSQLTLNITAPYTGAGLITIEKDKVYAYKWFKTNTNSTVQTITVPNNIEGNAYVNVSFIRSIDSKEIFTSPHSYAVVPFKISVAKRTVRIDLNSQELIRPGEELEISYKTSDNSKIIVYAVDQGILQVANYVTPNPLSFFFKKSALEIETYQTVDMILPDYKIIKEISGVGGGDAEYAMIEKNLNPFARKTNKPVVFWSKMLNSTTQFQTVKYKVPDYFNGQLKIMAVAATPDKAGRADRETIVKSPVIISPIAPLAALKGDTFEVTATVSNNIEGSNSASLDVWLETNNKFEILGVNKQTFEVKEGGEKIVRFNLKALDTLGSGNLTFKAQHKNEIFKAETSVSVRPAYAYQTKINSGILKQSKNKIDNFARNMYDEFANREIAVSYNPQLVFLSLKKYFSAYPYGCTEQIVSAAFPFIYSSTSDRKGFITADEQQTLFNHTLSKIRTRQQSSGGFSLWPDSTNLHPYASIYALHFFTDAKDLGYPVPPEILARGKNWLEYFASELPTSLEDARLKAYANYVLTRNNFITTNNLLRIEQFLTSTQKKWEEDIISAYLASCYSMLKDFKKAEKLINSFKPDAKGKFIFYSDFDSSSLRNATYLYLCNKHFAQNLNPDAQSIADGLVQVILDGKYNTVSSSYILLSLLSYGKGMEGKDANIKISIPGTDNKETDLTLQPDPFPYSKFDASVKKFTINADEKLGKSYYSIIQQGFDKSVQPYSNGIEITRDYLDENGVIIKGAKLGDTVTVRLRVRSKSNNSVTLALVDLLPACFEIISGTQSGRYESMDAREDRMVFHPVVSGSIHELTYKVKAVTKGTFTVPGVYAAGMYDPEVSVLTESATIEITQPGI